MFLEGAVLDAVDPLIKRVDMPLEFFAECASDHLDGTVVTLLNDADGALDEAFAADAHHDFALAFFVAGFTQTFLHALG